MFTTVNGYVFHIGLAIVVFLFVPHILLLKSLFGVSWPGLPSGMVTGGRRRLRRPRWSPRSSIA